MFFENLIKKVETAAGQRGHLQNKYNRSGPSIAIKQI